MHISVSIINGMWIAFHILHTVAKCCNPSRKMQKKIINNFNIALTVSRGDSLPACGPRVTKPLPIDVF